ncbi:MAG: hypothetical protein ABSB22_12725 [Thermodesulfobacteriota bacterium]
MKMVMTMVMVWNFVTMIILVKLYPTWDLPFPYSLWVVVAAPAIMAFFVVEAVIEAKREWMKRKMEINRHSQID